MAGRRRPTAPALASAAIAAVAVAFAPGAGPQADAPKKLDVIYVPTPPEVVDRMLALADPKKGETLYDLGSGDGRVVVAAASRYHVDAVGVEIDPKRVRESRAKAEAAGVSDRVTIREADLFTTDLARADVVTLYLLPNLNARLLPKLAKLKPGARVVCHSFDLRGVKPSKVERVPLAKGGFRTIYLYVAPLTLDPPRRPQIESRRGQPARKQRLETCPSFEGSRHKAGSLATPGGRGRLEKIQE